MASNYYPNADFSWEEGFGTYGPIGSDPGGYFNSGRWTSNSVGGGFFRSLVAPLGGAGASAFQVTGGGGGPRWLQKSLPGNYACVQGTIALENIDNGGLYSAVAFGDNGTCQVWIGYNASGKLVVYTGGNSGSPGTLQGTSTQIEPAGSVNWLGYKVVFHGSAGSVTLWLNGVATSIALTGLNTAPSGNAYANQFQIGQTPYNLAINQGQWVYDHLTQGCYLSGSTSDTPPMTNPVVLDQFAIADVSSPQFTPIQIGGFPQPINNATGAQAGNKLFLRQITAPCAGTISNILVNMTAASGASAVPCLYADSGSNTPAAVIAHGSALVGLSPGVNSLPLSSGQTVTAGTKYWIGFLLSAAWQPATNANSTSPTSGQANVTYSTTPPSTAPALTYAAPDFAFWAPVASSGANYVQVSNNPANGVYDYNQSSTVSNEDLFTFPALPSWVNTIYNIGVGVAAGIDTSGSRTFNAVTKSSTTSSNGSASGFAPGSSVNQTYYSEFPLDPNTSNPWLLAGANAAEHGYQIAS